METKWDSMDWEILKNNPELQLEYAHEFGIAKHDITRQEKLYDKNDQCEKNVFLSGDTLILNNNIKLLSEICSKHDGDNFKGEFLGVSPIGRAIMISRMLGFNFQQIAKKTKMTRKKVVRILEESIKKVVNKNRTKCSTCHYRDYGDYLGGVIKCRIWDIIINKRSSFCFLYKLKHERPKTKKIDKIEDYFHLKNCKMRHIDISEKLGKDRSYFYKVKDKWLLEGTGRIERFEGVFNV